MKPAEHKVLDPADTPSPKPRGVRILSMDGGGIRGLYTLDILRALQRACGGRPVRECFDLIVGTSTGAFVAGCLAAGKDLDAIEAEYVKVSVSFVGATPGFFSNIMRLLYGHVIDPAVIHGLLRGFFGTLTLDALPATPALLLVATDPCVGVPRPFLFRNAPLSAAAGADVFPCETRCSVADALRAVTAAPTYYPAHVIRGRTVVDGAVHANNPALFAIAEAAALFPNTPIDVLVSIGTGTESAATCPVAPSRSLTAWASTLLSMATETETPHVLAAMLLGATRYVRLSPERLGDCFLWEADKKVLAYWRAVTHVYCRAHEKALAALGARLVR